jgi:hypothetical protein
MGFDKITVADLSSPLIKVSTTTVRILIHSHKSLSSLSRVLAALKKAFNGKKRPEKHFRYSYLGSVNLHVLEI